MSIAAKLPILLLGVATLGSKFLPTTIDLNLLTCVYFPVQKVTINYTTDNYLKGTWMVALWFKGTLFKLLKGPTY